MMRSQNPEPSASSLNQGGSVVLATSPTMTGDAARRRGVLTMDGGIPASAKFQHAIEFGSGDALRNVIPLPPAEAALDDSGYSLHGTGPTAITCALGSPDAVLGEVTRLSPTVVWVAPREPQVDTSEARTFPVYLSFNGVTIGPLNAAFIRTDADMPHAPVGLQLVGVSVEQGREILGFLADALRRGIAEPAASALPVQDIIVDPERIRSIFSAICASGNKGVLRRQGRVVRMVLERFHASTGQLEWRTEESTPDWGDPAYDIDVIGYNSAYRMRAETGRGEGDRLFTTLPAQLFRIRHRWHRRVPAPEGIRARFHHPLWREQGLLRREVLDLSFSGLCVRCLPQDLMFPGLLPPLIELELGDGLMVSVRGEIRYVSGVRADGTVLCGLSVLPYSSDEARWVRFVSQTMSPATRTSEGLVDQLWDLFNRSGFFSLGGSSPEEFEELKLNFASLAKRAAEVPQLFCQAVWPSERGIEATLSFTKPYRHAWLGHQVAKRPGKPPPGVQEAGQIMRDIYLRTFEHPQSDPDFHWVIAYVEALNPWIAKAHVRYAERQMESGAGLAFTRKIQKMKAFSHELSGRDHREFEVGPATAGELSLLAATIARKFPTCYVESLDLTRDRLDMTPVTQKWKSFGMERERSILVARRHGIPYAAAVMELGQLGANLFRLLDNTRMFSLVEDGTRAYSALMDAARNWYLARRRPSFLYLREDEGGSYVQECGLHDGPDPYMWIISSKLVPDFLEHISELTIGRRGAHSR
ncbi:hypothetical protein D7Y13_02680 [Corallococcus praedator]|uniref:PilZ domain-containing protein n=2 Tax=Myxococcaceae TaxID=31 RepID=A0ABX9QQ59_9BACT|nr:hypothetical protein D7X74_00585 [Corallococcus sp. CA047B]RKH36473.1 hypothetical protein D7X75_00120 [Corallococcus sp. CA031C]RKI16308.1 hypothetical protein D7Y13_02680 [Corallococcus praedator]